MTSKRSRGRSQTGSANQNQRFVHRQFISKVASNKTKNQAVSKYKYSHPGLYHVGGGLPKTAKSSALQQSAPMDTQTELLLLEKGIVAANAEQSEGGSPKMQAKKGKRVHSAIQNNFRKPPKSKKERGKSAVTRKGKKNNLSSQVDTQGELSQHQGNTIRNVKSIKIP
jgi:hypothetical protein